ncbi:MAG: aspartate kinase, partial [Acidobacteria bacterium]|nr:aspartate kinase [Acidobacteriota bacterium]
MSHDAQDRRAVVLKFGGTSLADARRLRTAARIARSAAMRTHVVVVVSAMAGVTDALAAAAALASEGDSSWREMLLRLERRHLDALEELGGSRRFPLQGRRLRHRLEHLRHMLRAVAGGAGDDATLRVRILASGERLSALLFSAELRRSGPAAPVVDGSELIVTDSSFPEARVDLEATCHRACGRLAWPTPGVIPIVTGFIGADRRGRTTLLGRGASDLSATILGAALGARRVEIWTDVPGVLSAPPRWVPGARTVPYLSREEAGALARWGGKVLHPGTMVPLDGSSIPIIVGNSLDPAAGRTVIGAARGAGRPAAVSGRPGIALASGGGRGRAVIDP